MAKIEVDTKLLKECGMNILNLTKELNVVLNSVFSRFESMPTKTGEWVGPAAINFARRIALEKRPYYELLNNLNSYGRLVYNSAEKIEICERKSRL